MNIVTGHIRIGKLQVPRLTALGVLSVMFLFISSAGMYASSLGWWGNGDTVMHVDYVWQVSQGNLPVFEESIQYQPFNDKRLHEVQSASHHPPLYYILLSPFMSWFLESGQWEKAVAVGRIINIFIGCLTIIALAWAGWLFSRSRKPLFAVLVPAVVVSYPTFIKTGGDISPDMLVVLLTVLMFIYSYKCLRDGVSKVNGLMVVAIAMVGMLTKVSFFPAFIVAALVFFVSPYISKNRITVNRDSFMKSSLLFLILLTSVIATSGWFYYGHNYEESGSLTRAGSQEWISDRRDYRSYQDVILNPSLLFAALQMSLIVVNPYFMASILLLITLMGLYFLWREISLRKFIEQKHMILIATIFLIHFLILLVGQIDHAEGYGQVSARYFLPGMLFSALLLSYGILVIIKLAPYALAIFASLNITALFASHTRWLADKVSPSRYGELSHWDRITLSVTENWLPASLAYVLLFLIISTLILTSFIIYRLSISTKPIRDSAQ